MPVSGLHRHRSDLTGYIGPRHFLYAYNIYRIHGMVGPLGDRDVCMCRLVNGLITSLVPPLFLSDCLFAPLYLSLSLIHPLYTYASFTTTTTTEYSYIYRTKQNCFTTNSKLFITVLFWNNN